MIQLPGRHLGMEERTSPTAQPGKDWASCLPCHSNSTAWLHDSVRFINNYLIKLSQKSWCSDSDDQLTFKEHITKTARFCRFALHNIRKILTDPSVRPPVRRLLKNSVYHIKTSLMGIGLFLTLFLFCYNRWLLRVVCFNELFTMIHKLNLFFISLANLFTIYSI